MSCHASCGDQASLCECQAEPGCQNYSMHMEIGGQRGLSEEPMQKKVGEKPTRTISNIIADKAMKKRSRFGRTVDLAICIITRVNEQAERACNVTLDYLPRPKCVGKLASVFCCDAGYIYSSSESERRTSSTNTWGTQRSIRTTRAIVFNFAASFTCG